MEEGDGTRVVRGLKTGPWYWRGPVPSTLNRDSSGPGLPYDPFTNSLLTYLPLTKLMFPSTHTGLHVLWSFFKTRLQPIRLQ